jgi:hypothetical protein
MSQLDPLKAFREVILGARVDKAATALPSTTNGALFNVKGGKVLMTLLLGECTVAVGGANAVDFFHDPTEATAGNGAIGAAVDLNPWDVGDIVSMTGLLTDTILPAVHAGSTHASTYAGVIMTPGIVYVHTAGTTAGTFKWSLFYIPLDDGAYVEAA